MRLSCCRELSMTKNAWRYGWNALRTFRFELDILWKRIVTSGSNDTDTPFLLLQCDHTIRGAVHLKDQAARKRIRWRDIGHEKRAIGVRLYRRQVDANETDRNARHTDSDC